MGDTPDWPFMVLFDVAGTLDKIEPDDARKLVNELIAEDYDVDAVTTGLEYGAHIVMQYFGKARVSIHVMDKSKPENWLKLVNIITSPERCIAIDDKAENIAAAKAAGLKTILFKKNWDGYSFTVNSGKSDHTYSGDISALGGFIRSALKPQARRATATPATPGPTG